MRGGDVHTTLATQQTDGIGYFRCGAGTLKQIHLEAVGREDIGHGLGKQAAVVAHIVPDDHLDLLQVLEGLFHVVGKALSSGTHSVDVHAVAACTHDTTQTTGSKLQVFVKRLDKISLVLIFEHGTHLGLRLGVIALAQPQLGLLAHLFQ